MFSLMLMIVIGQIGMMRMIGMKMLMVMTSIGQPEASPT